jgi:glycosyltransferase involved in cell wall biosynthesis
MTTPLVSIVLPTRNGTTTLPAVFDAIHRQRVAFPFEVIAVDSASTDGTAEWLRNRADRVIDIPAGTFDHGLTRNLGIEHARGELIVLLVQDAVPASDDWLTALTRPLLDNRSLAGTFARQLPHSGASAITRYYLSRWVANSDAERTSVVSNRAEFEALDPLARFLRCAFDNVCSCIRRSVWAVHPFRSTPIGEDVEWAKAVLLDGHTLAYVPEAQVFHSHDRPARYEFHRTCVLHRRLHELFGVRTIPTIPLLARAVAKTLALHLRIEPSKAARGIALAVAWPLGQYLGALSAVRGWKPFRPGVV